MCVSVCSSSLFLNGVAGLTNIYRYVEIETLHALGIFLIQLILFVYVSTQFSCIRMFGELKSIQAFGIEVHKA